MRAALRIGFFGGSFDPPHSGHLAAAVAARDAFALDHVLLAPVAVQPLKNREGHVSYRDRLRMVELLAQETDHLRPSRLDAPRPDGAPNYTVEALSSLRDHEPDARLFSIVGLDAFLGLRQWRQPEQLLVLAEWIVVARPGSSFERLAELELSPEQTERVHTLRSIHVPVSATEVRARLAAGESCAGLVPAPVLAYIRKHRLYQQVQ